MTAPFRHVFEQGPALAALGRAAFDGLRSRAKGAAPPATPGPWIEAELPPRSEALVRDYVRFTGGDPSAYRGRVPAHMFPQWGFPLAARALAPLHHSGVSLARVVNAGCRIEQRAPLPAGEPLLVRARVQSIDDDGRRVIIVERIITGTRRAPEAIVADLRVYLPLAKKDEKNGEKVAPKERARVPVDAHEIAFGRVGKDAGLEFAKLTGDFNPIHWLPPYARASGFKGCILHGFATLARAIEALNRGRFAGDVSRLATVDARFTRPLVLPARVGTYVKENGIWVGDAPGGAAYLEGRFEEDSSRSAEADR